MKLYLRKNRNINLTKKNKTNYLNFLNENYYKAYKNYLE